MTNNFLKYLKSNFRSNCIYPNCSRIKYVDCISELSEVNTEDVSFKSLQDIWIKNLNRIVLAHFNINSLRSSLFADQIKGNVDVLAILETKLNCFPGPLKIPGCASSFRLDQNKNGGGILFFVREDIPKNFIFWRKNH